MEIRVEAEKQKSIKVKLQSDELAVRVGKTIAPDRVRPSVETLKAHFEETVTALRSKRSPSFPSPLPRIPGTDLLAPVCPNVSSFHPLLQTLLKLVWDSYLHEFHSVTGTFQEGVSMKVKHTERLATFQTQLDRSASDLVAALYDRAYTDVRKGFLDKWANKLADAKSALDATTNDVEELLELALQKATASQTLKPVQLHASVAECLASMNDSFRSRSDRLWDAWTLHMKRHKLVFDGNLKELEFVDKQIASLKQIPVIPSPAAVPNDESPESEASPWKELILMLSSVKLDFDIQIGSVAKLKEWANETLESSKASTMSNAFADLIKTEETQLSSAKVQLQRDLDAQKIVRDRVLRELRTACNNTLAPVDSVLKSMHLSFELALEAAREHVYVRALHELKRLC
jgi:hypothetical protein